MRLTVERVIGVHVGLLALIPALFSTLEIIVQGFGWKPVLGWRMAAAENRSASWKGSDSCESFRGERFAVAWKAYEGGKFKI